MEVKEEYEREIESAASLFMGRGKDFGNGDKRNDDFVLHQFSKKMDRVEPEHRPDVLKEVSKRLTKAKYAANNLANQMEGDYTAQGLSILLAAARPESLEALSKVFDKYKEGRVECRDMHVTDPNLTETVAQQLSKILSAGERGTDNLSPEEKSDAANKFQFALFDIERDMRPEEFQEVLKSLDKSLDKDGRDELDSFVEFQNYSEPQRSYETDRIKLSEEDKKKSWQTIGEHPIDKALRGFKERLELIHQEKDDIKSKLKSEVKDTVDNAILKAREKSQSVISDISNFVKNDLPKLYESFKDKFPNGPVCYKPYGESRSDEVKQSPFYDVMMDAYQQKASDLVDLINRDVINHDTAEEMFSRDIADIKEMSPAPQKELLESYSKGLRSMFDKDISVETRNSVTQLMKDYSLGKFDKQETQKPELESFKDTEMSLNDRISALADKYKDSPQDTLIDELSELYDISTDKEGDPQYAYEGLKEELKDNSDAFNDMNIDTGIVNEERECVGKPTVNLNEDFKLSKSEIEAIDKSWHDMPLDKFQKATDRLFDDIFGKDRKGGSDSKDKLGGFFEKAESADSIELPDMDMDFEDR